jgi:hypothetical protein
VDRRCHPTVSFSNLPLVNLIPINNRLALNGTFSILYLVGEFDKTAPIGDLMLSPAFVGVNHIFTAPTSSCDNCGHQEEQAHLITSTTPITSKLLDYVNTDLLQSMRPEHVKPFLVKNLKWRAIGVSILVSQHIEGKGIQKLTYDSPMGTKSIRDHSRATRISESRCLVRLRPCLEMMAKWCSKRILKFGMRSRQMQTKRGTAQNISWRLLQFVEQID